MSAHSAASWSVHCNFTGDGKCNERGWACTPLPSPARANFTLMTECMYARTQRLLLCVLCGQVVDIVAAGGRYDVLVERQGAFYK